MRAALGRVAASRRGGLALSFALGGAAALGQAPFGAAWVAFAAWILVFALLGEVAAWRSAAWRGWALGSGYFALSLSWIVEPFLVDIARHGWMAPFALVLMAGGLALFWAAAFGLAARFATGRHQRLVFLVLAMTGAEMLRSVVFTGFPWALVGHIWIGWPQMQLAALVGAPGLTLLTLAAAALPALLGARRALTGVVLALACMSVPAVYAHWRLPAGAAASVDPPLVVRLVQPNAPQDQRWLPEMIPVFFQRSLDLTAAPPDPDGDRPALVIWPETAVQELLRYAEPAFLAIAAAAQGAETLVGIQRVDAAGRWFNSLVVLDPAGAVRTLYDKHHLVPFGEYMPLIELFARWGVFGLAANTTGGYAAGPGPRLIDLGAIGQALPLICYEAIFAADIARAPGRAGLLVQITNDAWFGSFSGPYQHLAQARLRAVEQGLPMLRAANTGISAAFDPYGREIASLPLGQAGFVDVTLPAPLTATFYARFGDLPVLLLLLVLGTVAVALPRYQRAG